MESLNNLAVCVFINQLDYINKLILKGFERSEIYRKRSPLEGNETQTHSADAKAVFTNSFK